VLPLGVLVLVLLALIHVSDWAAEGQGLLGLVLGCTGGMLHQTRMMHHGFDRATLS